MTSSKEDFVPYDMGENAQINMYVCGPTVYNLLHIGNMRCYVVFDTIRRYFEHKGFLVNVVQNFTDIDDKIIQSADEEGISATEVAEKYIAEAYTDFKAMNILAASVYPRVTEEMPEIIAMIAELIEKGFAYESDGHVFFDSAKTEDYGKLSKKNIDDLIAGARVEVHESKRSSVDFVLWKPRKTAEEPSWASPWSDGRPGWHIECSAIAKKYLGRLDLHCGGEDLIFPHHENEIAQTEALQDEPLARYWLHNGPLTSNGRKMSKSLGNFSTLREVAQNFSHEVIRFFLLSGHYRMPIEYSEELLISAEKSLNRIKNAYNALRELAQEPPIPVDMNTLKYRLTFETCMDDDFNTANAIAVLFDIVKDANMLIRNLKITPHLAHEYQFVLHELCELLGIKLGDVQTLHIGEEYIEEQLRLREMARKNKDWAKSDEIRDALTAQGVIIKDTPEGAKWTIR